MTSQLSSVEKAWKFLLAMGAGTGLVLILRWYWWRINAWSEISAMVVSFLASLVFMKVVPPLRSRRSECRRVDHDRHGRRDDRDVGRGHLPHQPGTGRCARMLSIVECGRAARDGGE